MRTLTVRIDEALAREVDVARRVLDVSTVDFVRVAVAGHLDRLSSDPDFQRRAELMLERNERTLRRARATPLPDH